MHAHLPDTSQLCIHTITTRAWDLPRAVAAYARAGVGGVTVWRQALAGRSARQSGEIIRSAGMEVVSLCRGGFFPARDPAGRQAAIDDNLRAIDQAAELGAPLLVLVPGAVPGLPLEAARGQIAAGIAACLPHAAASGVRLGIEPLHPMYADDRSAVNTLRQANDLCALLASPFLGVVVDVYHLWWDPELQAEIARCGQNNWLFAYHISDWITPTTDLLNDRGLMGSGCIPLRQIRSWVAEAGFKGFNEVEIFSNTGWALDPDEWLARIIRAYLDFA